jgi:RNA polymerase sigma-70 factor (ECF subfamily)
MHGHSTTLPVVTLLARLAAGDADDAAWQEFVDLYGPFVLDWCREHGCPESELEDVLQEVLIKLMRAFPTFRYNPQQRFRSFIATIAQHALTDLFRSRQLRFRGSGDTEVWSRLQSVPAQRDLVERINAAFDLELFYKACAMVRAKVPCHTWQTFELTNVQHLSVEEAAERLGITPATLYVTRSRVAARVKTELQRLQRAIDGDGS